MEIDEDAPRIAITDPKPLPTDDRCPRCKAGTDKRVASAGFGNPHDVCSRCGFEWEEFTL